MNASPFPGMDPYLESHWGDIHQSLVIYARDQIQAQLPSDLRARVEERVAIESPLEEIWGVYPDVRVIERPIRLSGNLAVAEIPDTDLTEPLLIECEDEPVTESFIEIVDAGSRQRVITVIEFLSESNKRPGRDRQKFLRKRKDLRRGKVSLVEIDLLRSGRRLPPIVNRPLPSHYQTPYCALILRAWQRRFEYYRVPLRERLPKLAIPLRETERPAILDLQSLIQQCYANGGYDDIDYSREPVVPLDTEDAAWADMLLREQHKRT